ncbi:hypothetical protein PF005_g13765 [Phytophthora fragariae]|uniref:Uncharacterized protein n=1 Tax=Phytophthora fragariae TaxID=53985 RepID=A0A6A3ENB4_9STRA|nr:hypothetical protein PF003_g28999 [Phytophthora fragariae]KAE8886808.1 hypothetical protein PF003_g28998 [Phytophthora fragariae]KAE8934955.1 hypothetical protein PF009_g15079 [Phytophthora fragariae]KAE9003743.1 hypothetical protein PF011_g12766 [Phytophthora fragariae]KAE9104088.1 hypothetical protein PF010_g13497 [Phytophthora fragariae]
MRDKPGACCTCQADLPGPPQSRANFARLSSVRSAQSSLNKAECGVDPGGRVKRQMYGRAPLRLDKEAVIR